MSDSIKNEINRLKDLINYYNYKYYTEDAPKQ
jgi:NAD-dependent DNA ligase